MLRSFEEACQHLDRWQTADLTFDHTDESSHLLERPVALLEALTVKGPSAHEYPLDLFAREAPMLRRVQISDFCINWPSEALAGLLILDLKHLSYAQAPDVAHLIDILASSPQLSSLRLFHVHIPDPSSRSMIIQLPNLVQLELKGLRTSVSIHLVRHIVAVPHEELRLDVSFKRDSPASVIPHITSLLSQSPTGKLEILVMHDSVELSLTLDHRRDRPVVLVVLMDATTFNMLETLTATLPRAFFKLDTTVILQGLHPGEALNIVPLVNHLNVTRLCLIEPEMDPILQRLAEPEDVGEMMQWCFPYLRETSVCYEGRGGTVEGLKKMIEARKLGGSQHYLSEESDNDSHATSPAQLTSLAVDGIVEATEDERASLRDLVGLDVLDWRAVREEDYESPEPYRGYWYDSDSD